MKNYEPVMTFDEDMAEIYDDLPEHAGTTPEAVDLAAQMRPDVVLMDVGMPRMSGIVAAELIKAVLPSVHIVMLTGYGEEAFKRAGVEAGVYRYLAKDCPPELL